MPLMGKRSSKTSTSARKAKQNVSSKTTTVKASRGRPSKALHKTELQSRDVGAASNVGASVDYRNPNRATHAMPFTSNPREDEASRETSRRMSLLFGHGHTLEPQESKEVFHSSPDRKRKRSLSASELSPKKVRFNPTTDETRVIQEGKVRSRPASPAAPTGSSFLEGGVSDKGLDDARASVLKPEDVALEKVAICPEPLGLLTVADLFKALQSQTKNFGEKRFGFSPQDVVKLGGDHSRKNFPLHDLEHTYPALYWTTLNILDVPTDNARQGWLDFFTRPTQRQALVYGILGEWLSQRVFKDSSFGLSDKIKDMMLQNVDIHYLHYDSFVRAKHRARLVKAAFEPSEREFTLEAIDRDSSALADELMIVLAPLMPTWRFDDPFAENPSPHIAHYRRKVKLDLTDLIRKAAGLNLSLIRTGEKHVVFYIAQRLERGREYSSLAPMDSINKTHKTAAAHADPDMKLMVRMTCWARIEAYIAHGKNQEEMEIEQESLMSKEIEGIITEARRHATSPTTKQFEKSYKRFCWDCLAPKLMEVLPADLWLKHKEIHDKIEINSRSAKLARKQNRELKRQLRGANRNGDDSDHSDLDEFDLSDDSSTSSDEDDHHHVNGHEEQDVPRGAYIYIADKLVNHQVYCEWVKPIGEEVVGTNGSGQDGNNLRELNSLRTVVRRARAKSKSSLVGLTDFKIRIWNLYATNNLWIEWASALALAIYLGRNGLPASVTALTDSIMKAISTRLETTHEYLHKLLPDLWWWEYLAEDFINQTRERIGSPTELVGKLLKKLQDLFPAPPPLDLENGMLTQGNASLRFGSVAAFKTAILSAFSAVLPWHMPLLLPPNPPTYHEDLETINTGPAITLTVQGMEPTPSRHARRW